VDKRMVGDIFVVVVDEIGEVTFARSPMFPDNVELSKKETLDRVFCALIELLDLCSTLVPTSRAQSYIQSALELTLANYDHLKERFTEQVEFIDSLGEAADSGWLLEGNTHRRFVK